MKLIKSSLNNKTTIINTKPSLELIFTKVIASFFKIYLSQLDKKVYADFYLFS